MGLDHIIPQYIDYDLSFLIWPRNHPNWLFAQRCHSRHLRYLQ